MPNWWRSQKCLLEPAKMVSESTAAEGRLLAAEEALAYTFRERKWLRSALTHMSFLHEHPDASVCCYEQLEFLGDALAGAVAAEWLFTTYPDRREGELTQMRAFLCCEERMAEAARTYGLGACVFLGRSEEMAQARERDALLADVLEALLGAVYLDGGWEAARMVTLRLFAAALPRTEEAFGQNHKSLLQHRAQTTCHCEPVYTACEAADEVGRLFHAEVRLDGRLMGAGIGRTKKLAEMQAAAAALRLTDTEWQEQLAQSIDILTDHN